MNGASDETATPQVTPAEAPAPSPSSSAAVPSAEERLAQLQEKTAAWKKAVATQLAEAAAKNKALRDELHKSREDRDADMATLRVQLTREFKERTAMKEDEVTQLHTKIEELYAEQKRVAVTHVADMARVEERVREACALEAAEARQKAVAGVQHEVSGLRTQLEAKDGDLAREKDAVARLTTRLERLGLQYQELSSVIHRRSGGRAASAAGPGTDGEDAHGSDDGTPSAAQTSAAESSPSAPPSAAFLHDVAHQRQLDEAQAELQEREREVQRQLDAARREHELQMGNLVRELHRRDEHTVMLQTLQKQLQQDLMNAQQRVTGVQEEKAALEQRLAGKVAALSKELADRLEAQSQAQQEEARLLEQQRLHMDRIAELETEAASREAAFAALMLSEDDKQLVGDLQRQLQAARAEADAYKARLDGIAERTASGEDEKWAESGGTTGGAEDADGSAQALQLKAAQLEHKARALEADRVALQQQRDAQRVTESKLEAMKRSLATQANHVFRGTAAREGGTDGHGGSDTWGVTPDEAEDASSPSHKVHQRSAGSGAGRRAPLSFDANAAQASGVRRSWAGTVGGGGFLSWVPSRLRVLIPLFIFLFMFFSVLNIKAGDAAARASAGTHLRSPA